MGSNPCPLPKPYEECVMFMSLIVRIGGLHCHSTRATHYNAQLGVPVHLIKLLFNEKTSMSKFPNA